MPVSESHKQECLFEESNIGTMGTSAHPETPSDTSRASTPDISPPIDHTSSSVACFFSSVALGKFPVPEEKVQPWKEVWRGPKQESPEGRLYVACPKAHVYGSNVLGGY